MNEAPTIEPLTCRRDGVQVELKECKDGWRFECPVCHRSAKAKTAAKAVTAWRRLDAKR